jgi:hypothetical protein
MLATTMVPAYVHADEPQKQVATESQIEECSTAIGITEVGGILMGFLPMFASGAVAASKTYNALAPLSTCLATGVAIPSAIVTGLATLMVFQLPMIYLAKKYQQTYDEKSATEIIWQGHDKTDYWTMNAIVGIPAVYVAGCLSVAIAKGILSLA